LNDTHIHLKVKFFYPTCVSSFKKRAMSMILKKNINM